MIIYNIRKWRRAGLGREVVERTVVSVELVLREVGCALRFRGPGGELDLVCARGEPDTRDVGGAVLDVMDPGPPPGTVTALDLDSPNPLAGDGWAGPWRVLPADRWPREATWWWTATTTHEGASCS